MLIESSPSGLYNSIMRFWWRLTGSPRCWLRWSRWDLSPCFHPWWETSPRSTSAAAGELWSRSPSGKQVGNQSQGIVPKRWIDRMWDISGSHPLVIRIDSYSHYPASRQTSKLSILELQRKMYRSLDGDSGHVRVCLHSPVPPPSSTTFKTLNISMNSGLTTDALCDFDIHLS